MFNIKRFKNGSNQDVTIAASDTSCSYDAVRIIAKRFGIGGVEKIEALTPEQYKLMALDKAEMPEVVCASTIRDERDENNEAIGEEVAVRKAMKNHKTSLNKALLRWQVAMLRKVQAVSPESFTEAYNKITK